MPAPIMIPMMIPYNAGDTRSEADKVTDKCIFDMKMGVKQTVAEIQYCDRAAVISGEEGRNDFIVICIVIALMILSVYLFYKWIDRF